MFIRIFLCFYSRILLTLNAIEDTEVTYERPLFSFFRETCGFFPGISNAYEANIENADDAYVNTGKKRHRILFECLSVFSFAFTVGFCLL